MHETPPSPDPAVTDSAEAGAHGPARRIPLNLVYDYPVHWSKYKVLRDLIQNFFDSIPRAEWHRRFGHRLVGERLILTSLGVDFSYDWLIPIGASTKRDGEGLYAGYFGEGFKIAALCAVRDHGWQIEVNSRDWRLAVVSDTLKVDGRELQSLAYDIAHSPHQSADTVLTITPFRDAAILEAALLSFFYPANPLLGAEIWSGRSGAVYSRSQRPKPDHFPATYDSPGAGIVFAGFQALGSFPHPLVFCLHDYRSNDRERNDFYMSHHRSGAATCRGITAAGRRSPGPGSHPGTIAWSKTDSSPSAIRRWRRCARPTTALPFPARRPAPSPAASAFWNRSPRHCLAI